MTQADTGVATAGGLGGEETVASRGHARGVLVMGPPRGGTSVLARVLALLSWERPADVVDSLPEGGTGFREPVAVSQLDEELLAAVGSGWNDWRLINPESFQASKVDPLRRQAARVLEGELGGGRLAILADPRLSRLVPFWASALEQARAERQCAVLVRNPLEVAASLRDWHGLSLPVSVLVWLRHCVDAEAATRSLARVFVSFDDLVRDWRAVSATIAERLGLELANRSAATERTLDGLVDPARRRHTADSSAVAAHPDVPRWVKRTYGALLRLCDDPQDASGQEALDHVRLEFDAACQAFGAVLGRESMQREEWDRVRSDLEARARNAEAEAHARECASRPCLGRLASLSSTAASLEGLLAAARVRESELAAVLQAGEQRKVELGEALALAARRRELARHLREFQSSALWSLAHRLLLMERRWPRLGRVLAWAPRVPFWLATGRLRDRLRLRQQAREVVRFGVFDADWYLENNPDVAGSGWNPLLHWLTVGLREGRDPRAEWRLSEHLASAASGSGGEIDALLRQLAKARPDAGPGRGGPAASAAGPVSGVSPALAVAGGAPERLPAPARTDGPAGGFAPDGQPIALLIDSIYPRPDRDSGSVDAMNHIHFLQRLGFQVVFAADAEFTRPSEYLGRLLAEGVACVTWSAYPSIERFVELHGDRIAVCFLSRVYSGGRHYESARRYAPRARVIFNTVDLHSLREERGARLRDDRVALNRAAATLERELYLARASDATIVVSDEEKRLLEQWVPGTRVVMLPLLRPIPGRTRPFQDRSGIGFVGGFLHEPNVDAVTYFLDEVWPLVRRALPGVQFFIIGADMPESLASRPGADVVPIGYVPDLTAQLESLRLTVAPLRYGAGAKGKVASSLAHGVPCVATTVAVEGMGLAPNIEVAVADSPTEMAAALQSLYQDQDRWNRMSEASLERASQLFSVDRGLDIMAALLAELGIAVQGDAVAATDRA